MYAIDGTTIILTKGDTARCLINIVVDGEPYVPQEGDIVRFAVKKAYSSRPVLISKIVPNGSQILTLNPADTKRLPAGDYVYDVEMTFANGDVHTFIEGELTLKPEVE